MNLIEWSPFKEIDREIAKFFEHLPYGGGLSPKVDILQSGNDVVVKAEIPGVPKEDISVYVDEFSVRLSGEIKETTEYSSESLYQSERYYGRFSRAIALPVKVKPDFAHAEYSDGILSISIPKVEPEQIRGKKLDIS